MPGEVAIARDVASLGPRQRPWRAGKPGHHSASVAALLHGAANKAAGSLTPPLCFANPHAASSEVGQRILGDPFTLTMKCTWGPVDIPVLPTGPITSPLDTASPVETHGTSAICP